MNITWNIFINDWKSYLDTFQFFEQQTFWYVILPLLAFLLLIKTLLWIKAADQSISSRNINVIRIYRISIQSIFIIVTLLIVLYSYYWSTDFYQDSPIQLVQILGLGICLLTGIILYWKWARLFHTHRLKEMIGQPLTHTEYLADGLSARKIFLNSRIWAFLPLLGFLIFLLLSTTAQFKLVSIVLDTSSSMSGTNDYEEIPLETGKELLQKTILELDPYTDIIITHFENGEYLQNIAAITSTQTQDKLRGISIFYGGDEQAYTREYINTLGEEMSSSSPLCETIWKNFLHTKSQFTNKPYQQVVQIIITDGAGNIPEGHETFLCGNNSYNEFYSEPDQVNIIDLGGETKGAFIQQADRCNYYVQDGSNADAYADSLNSILTDFKRSWTFPLSLLLLCMTTICIIYLIQPKPIT